MIFQMSIKHIPSHTKHNDHHQQTSSTHHTNKHKHRTHCQKDKFNEITSDTNNPLITCTETNKPMHDTDVDSSEIDFDSTSDSK